MSTNSRITKIQSQLSNIADDIRYLMNTSESMTLQDMGDKISIMREQKWCKPGTGTETGTSSDDSGKFFNVWEIEWMTSLPSINYKYFNPIYAGLIQSVYFDFDFSLLKEITTFKPSILYTFDEEGNQGVIPSEQRVGFVEAETVLQTIDDISEGGQGIRISLKNVFINLEQTDDSDLSTHIE